MPYSIDDNNPDCSGYAVVKDTDGTVMGCHKTRKEALAQQAALYASEADQARSAIECTTNTTTATVSTTIRKQVRMTATSEKRELPPSYRPSSSDDVPVTRPSCASCEYFCLMPDPMDENLSKPHCHRWMAPVALDGYCDAYEPKEDEGESEGEGGGMGGMEMDSARPVMELRAVGDPALIVQMQKLLADTVSFYFQAHGAHWNVRGADFAQYHELFSEIYEDVYSAVDPTAENVRKLGGEAPFRLSDFIALRSGTDIGSTDTPLALASDLLLRNDELLVVLKSTFDLANAVNEQGIANFIAERIDMHQKWSWQLRSSTEMVEQRKSNNWVVRSVDEKRSIAYTTFECRAAGDTGNTLVGYAAMFDSPSVDMGFTEYVARGAFAKTLKDGADVRLLIDHEGAPLARTRSGTLRLSEDDRGLRVEADLDPSNPLAQTVLSALRRGDMNQMSFAFRTIKDSWSKDGRTRELREVQLYDVSVVTFPAYEATVAEVRGHSDATLTKSESRAKLRKAQARLAAVNL